jgi:hypothetical protein
MTTVFQFAIVTEWEDRLYRLAELAERERWTYTRLPSSSPLPILDSYVKFTFQTALQQRAVCESEVAACFNTGLLTSNHEEIFGYFVRSEYFDIARPAGLDNKKWFLRAFIKESDGRLFDFDQPPPLVRYWQSPDELLFNPSVDVVKNVDHIVVDNLERFPAEEGGRLGLDGVPEEWTEEAEEAREASPPTDSTDDDATPSTVSIPPDVLFRLRTRLDGAIEHSLRLARRSYRVSVPQFYKGRIQLLLPLYLRSRAKPDLALTLQRHGGRYRAATVLYPDWAYRHARLLSRPNSEWLGGFRDVTE